MSKPPTTESPSEDELLSQIESSYHKGASEAPSAAVERQILNYARQQLKTKNKAHKLTQRLGSRKLMPFALAASLFFVVLSISWLWQETVYMPPGTSGNQEGKLINAQKGKPALRPIESKASTNNKNRDYSSGGKLSEQEWADEIINLVERGKMDAATAELARFKLTYPNYPIEQRIAKLQR